MIICDKRRTFNGEQPTAAGMWVGIWGQCGKDDTVALVARAVAGDKVSIMDSIKCDMTEKRWWWVASAEDHNRIKLYIEINIAR